MIKFENIVTPSAEQWRIAILGARNPMNSWDRSDSYFNGEYCDICPHRDDNCNPNKPCFKVCIGPNDLKLMMKLRNTGPDHRKFMRMLPVIVTITAPLYWWKEFDTYKVGTVANSCSTMHKIHAKEFTLEDFSCEHLMEDGDEELVYGDWVPLHVLEHIIAVLNRQRKRYLETKDKKYWWQMIQLLPTSYNQKRTVMLNYEVLTNIYKSRKNHKLDEWKEHKESTCPVNENTICSNPKEFLLCDDCSVGKGFCDWIKNELPYSTLITGDFDETGR